MLDVLERHRAQKIRAVGSLHSWSEAPACPQGVTVDLGAFNSVELSYHHGEAWVEVGGGCTLQRLLDSVHANSNFTLPTLGAIKLQTVAGAISTATHGSGRPSLSHFVEEVRLASYRPDPALVDLAQGDELRAARCSLGCMGIILKVKFRLVPRYLVEETVRLHTTLEEVLEPESDHPLQQFVLIPHSWKYGCWRRRALPWRPLSSAEKVRRLLYRWNNYLGVDLAFHLILKGLLLLGFGVRRFYHVFPKLMLTDQTFVDESEPMLTLEHHLFLHEEMELFIPATRLNQAVGLIKEAISYCAGDAEISSDSESLLEEHGLIEPLERLKGRYLHHYPLAFRRVLAEDTLISMAAGTQTYYSVSFFTYQKDRATFREFCRWMARALNRVVNARVHWGKFCPLEHEDLAPLYPRLQDFNEIARDFDPEGVFRTAYVIRLLS